MTSSSQPFCLRQIWPPLYYNHTMIKVYDFRSWRAPVTGVILLTVEYMSKVLVRMTVAKQLTKCFMQIKSEIHLIFSSFSHRLNVQIFKLCCNVDLFMGAAILIGRKHFFILPTTTYSLFSTQHCIYWWKRM